MTVKVSVLGIGGAIPSKDQDSTFLSLQSPDFSALIDCGGSPLLRIQNVGINPSTLDALIITHRHPDHIYGIPSLLQGLGLLRRKKQLQIFGCEDTISLLNSIIDLFELRELVGRILEFNIIPFTPNFEVFHDNQLAIHTNPVNHGIPTIAVRIRNNLTGRSLTYTSDTSPCEELVEFANYSDILIHECNNPFSVVSSGHSNGKEAGIAARLIRAKKLVLVHLPVYENLVKSCIESASCEYNGDIDVPEQYMSYLI